MINLPIGVGMTASGAGVDSPAHCAAALILPPPSLDQDLGFRERVKDLSVQQFIPQRAVERLDVPVLPRAARLDEQRLHLQGLEPEPDELRRELRAVVEDM